MPRTTPHSATLESATKHERASSHPPSRHPPISTPASAYADIGPTIARLQYERYRARGGRKARGPHHSDHAYNSPCRANMSPGEPYRRWFHDHISRTHYSLGEATDHYSMDPHHLPPQPHFTPIRPRPKQHQPQYCNTQPRPSPDHRAGGPHISRRRQRRPG
jgi:hypothetical protein